MTSLSRLIKSSHYSTSPDKRIIEVADIARPLQADRPADEPALDEETAAFRDRVLKDAEEAAELRLQEAQAQAEQMLAQAREEIEQWWLSRRQEDEQAMEAARRQGYEQGYAKGLAAAEQAVRQEYGQMLAQARTILESAARDKQAIIQEAEPFLVELATAIAGKIIGKQLTIEPAWTIDLIRSVLARRREQGTIVLRVSPAQYSFVCDARETLLQSIDSQAELIIVADSAVEDHGCIVRSNLGSLDARIDTQLKEIRSALLQLTGVEEGNGHS